LHELIADVPIPIDDQACLLFPACVRRIATVI
jgi:hypothetical protein